MQILLIDNYDSFTFNIYQYLLELGHTVQYYRNDELTIEQISQMVNAQEIDVIFLSPGPKAPQDAGICLDIVREFYKTVPIFGICLGHQAIAEALGGKVVPAKDIMHGKVSKIIAHDIGIMRGLREFNATRYHSLAVERSSLPSSLIITAETAGSEDQQSDGGEIMALKHRDYPIESVQFHPESILTPVGKHLIEKFLNSIHLDQQNNQHQYKQQATVIPLKNFQNDAIHNNTISSLTFFNIFTQLYKKLGKNSVCLLDSASGLQLDNAENIGGIFPKFDLILANGKLQVITEYPQIKQAFIDEFSDIYNSVDDYFAVQNMKFSDYFGRIRNLFQVSPDHNFKLSYSNGLIGYFSYEYLHNLERISRNNLQDYNYAEFHLTYYAHILHVVDNQLVLLTNSITDDVESELVQIRQIIEDVTPVPSQNSSPTAASNSSDLEFSTSTLTHDEFIKAGDKAKQYIIAGDIFQVQISIRRQILALIDPLLVYSYLRQINPSPYMFLYSRPERTHQFTLISNSPELQLKVEGGEVLIRPIAGTSKGKGSTDQERELKRSELINSPKEQAEHIMLVDLARNDIGKWCKPGSVAVDDLLSVAEYANVFHIVSSVRGTLQDDVDSMCIFESTFPAGTLTGAPKVRAMEIISELERFERGAYGGAFGFFDFSGNILSSIIIRTIVQVDDSCYVQSAAGIVYDSDLEDEYNETLHKTSTLKQVLANVLQDPPHS
jgi:para-aminobenzoate synthetase